MEKDSPLHLVTPTSVKAIISRIKTAQLTRTQEDISSQLSDILDNVNYAINRFQEELGYDLKEKAKSYQSEQKGKKRFILLEKIASFSKDAKTKEKHLYEIFRWLGDWGDSLAYEVKNGKSEEEEEALDEWIEVVEKVLPLSLMATKGGIESLISLCSTLIEEQKKRAQMSKHNFWQDWLEKSPQKSSLLPQPPSPEQMLQDKNITYAKVSEVRSMLEELLDSTMFNHGEVKAIRYMSAVVENLNKALVLQHKENKSLETKYRYLKLEMTKELSSQKVYFQKTVQVLESKRDALLKQVEVLGKKYHDLLLIKHALEFQLKTIQCGSGQEEQVEVFADFPGIPEKETLPEKETAVKETQPELEEDKCLFSQITASPMIKAWDIGVTPSAQQRLYAMMESRISNVFSSRSESLEPVMLSSEVPKFPTQWSRLVVKDSGHESKDHQDLFQEKEGVQSEPHHRKHPSPESSRQMSSEDQAERQEEELSWERKRQQWLQEEEEWLQRQKKWALLEQEHQEKLRQWEAEEAVKQQWQKLVQTEEEQQSPRREREEQKKEEERLIFVPTSRWKNLEKADPSSVSSRSRSQSARQSRRPQAGQGNQRALCSAMSSDEFQSPRARQVHTRPRKSASFPITAAPIRRMTRTPLQKSPAVPKDRLYHIGPEAQRKNLQLLSGESALQLPHYLRNKALEFTTTTMNLTASRLRCLCHKYIHYRHFQSLRQEVIKHIGIMRQTRATHKAQSLYVFLENIDHQQTLRLQAWTDQQKDLEEEYREYLRNMVAMFPKLQHEWNVHLNVPVVLSAKTKKCKSPPAMKARFSGSTSKQPSLSKHWESVPLWMTGQQSGNQLEAIWKTDLASSSYPIEKKRPASLSWDQLGGHPDIPRLLAVDETSSSPRGMMFFKSCASTTQRKECQEPAEEPAELVRKLSSQSLPASLQSQKDRCSSASHSIP